MWQQHRRFVIGLPFWIKEGWWRLVGKGLMLIGLGFVQCWIDCFAASHFTSKMFDYLWTDVESCTHRSHGFAPGCCGWRKSINQSKCCVVICRCLLVCQSDNPDTAPGWAKCVIWTLIPMRFHGFSSTFAARDVWRRWCLTFSFVGVGVGSVRLCRSNIYRILVLKFLKLKMKQFEQFFWRQHHLLSIRGTTLRPSWPALSAHGPHNTIPKEDTAQFAFYFSGKLELLFLVRRCLCLTQFWATDSAGLATAWAVVASTFNWSESAQKICFAIILEHAHHLFVVFCWAPLLLSCCL